MFEPEKCWCGGVVEWTERKRLCDPDPVRIYRCADAPNHDPAADWPTAEPTLLYVAGPMSGLPSCNYPAFNRAARRLRQMGYEVRNPAEDNDVSFGHYKDFLVADLKLLLDCEGVAVLDGWWSSHGARNEVAVASALRLPVRTVSDWIDRSEPDRWQRPTQKGAEL